MRLSKLTILLFLAAAASSAVRAQPATAPAEESDRDLIRRIESFHNVHHEALYETRDPALRAQFEAMQWDLIGRPQLQEPGFLATAYRNLLALARTDSTTTPEEWVEITQGLAEHAWETPEVAYAESAILLAERAQRFDDAEAFARRGMDSVLVQVERDRNWFASDEDYEIARDEQRSIMTDALGWIFHLAGRADSAEATLLRAHALWTENVDNLYHLGRYYEANGRTDRAEEFYRRGALVSTPTPNPNRAALRALFQRTRGNLEGWEEHERSFEEADRAAQRSAVLSTREAHPAVVPRFALASMRGDTITSDVLDGRITVVNFWGVWCGWCVKEMPDFQRLHERYADDDEVLILTINNDADWSEAVAWMRDRGFDFPVLRDDGYVAGDAGVRGFPTTWFVDRDGQIAYQKRGWTENLLEEFSWRIESLREASAAKP